jgi:phosphoribosylamine--glycine ligase
VWALLQSETVREVFCVPGNGGTAQLAGCRNIAMSVLDFEGIARLSLVNNVGLVVVGPEVPLAAGITDYLQKEGINVFGPTKAGAQIEASKIWAKALMETANIPTAAHWVFKDLEPAIAFLESAAVPIVIKADGLAAGKGVTVAMTQKDAIAAVKAAFEGKFGNAGDQVVIEECLVGQEASVLAITDGISIRPLLPAQDHKRIGEGDTGPNTGGMGAYAPAPVVSDALMDRIQREILEPAIAALRQKGIDYRGVLYAGLMITPAGDPKVIEFNCRFGDPETQAVLPLLETPLDKVLLACVEQRLSQLPPLDWKPGFATCVVAAADGYPDVYTKGHPITGLDAAQEQGAVVFHAGTTLKQGVIVSDGGRVLGVTAIGDTVQISIAQTYEAIAQIQFEGMYIRSDIGYRILHSS